MARSDFLMKNMKESTQAIFPIITDWQDENIHAGLLSDGD